MTVIGCTGHQNLPRQAIGFIANAIRSELSKHDSATLNGVCSLAAGADQLFAQSVLDVGGRLKVIVPSSGFETTFDRDDKRRYYELLSKAASVETLDWPEPTEDAFLSAGHRIVRAADVLIAIWDGQEARGKGGTADVVRYAQTKGRRVLVIWPAGVNR
jgi:hypothetical protein